MNKAPFRLVVARIGLATCFTDMDVDGWRMLTPNRNELETSETKQGCSILGFRVLLEEQGFAN